MQCCRAHFLLQQEISISCKLYRMRDSATHLGAIHSWFLREVEKAIAGTLDRKQPHRAGGLSSGETDYHPLNSPTQR